VKVTFGFWVIRCETILKVETGEGYVKPTWGIIVHPQPYIGLLMAQ